MEHVTGSIKEWAEADRPREKLMQKGRQSLSDAELLAILIGSGTRHESALEIARRILTKVDNNLHALGLMPLNELRSFRGIGNARAIIIQAALELGLRRTRDETRPPQDKIRGAADVAAQFRPLLCDLMHEEFWVLLLNRANTIIGKEQISKGGLTGTVADPRLIFRSAIDRRAAAIVVCHNHPSGNLSPSEQDIRLTKNLVEAGKVLEIPVLDHIIITQHGFYSFADEGRI
ncbi:MAG TPA: DNA repair protein RadC [Bacteroidia bacterium]|jgi:DNA repair protein RadC|uniref:RadC family protein n=1 Tax=Candidatus Pollutiaquabacter sp. TaxID=3416354 RepID=UPI001A57E00D|nr:DNA repair protein RadC [Bacteroidota bacterium]MBL7948798.1 DNA repair protein RadC [Bacteroidia bacterium]HRS38453.1 DNA repair protein RadC [Bacteroidia bacterium]HRU61763.1 DNA repair protein RadC [Bacteroidia bacterium]